MDLKERYQQRFLNFEKRVGSLERKDRIHVILRLIVGILLIGSVVIGLYHSRWELILPFLLSTATFIWLVKRHQDLRRHLQHHKVLMQINAIETNYHEHDLSLLPDGVSFRNPVHLFADDLDLFGSGSLFQRVNRSMNRRGQQHLSERLFNDDFTQAQAAQGAVIELKPMIDWRQDFMATANQLEGAVNEHAWLGSSPEKDPKAWWQNSFFLWGLSLWFPILAFSLWLFMGNQAVDYLLYPFLINVALFFQIYRAFRQRHQSLDNLVDDLAVYSRLFNMIETVDWKSERLGEHRKRLSKEGQKASQAIKDLSEILSRMDSVNNAVGAILMNGCCFYHLHVMRSAFIWRANYAHFIQQWVDVVHGMEAEVSLANYAFNHPASTFPKLLEDGEQRFEVESIGHPFLSLDHNVRNSISFDSKKLVVLTGSNMSGKSTFLRSLGLSLVMMGLGLPVCADSMASSPFRLLTSMKPQDDVNNNTSYFQAEVLRLRAIMDVIAHGNPCFVLLDEILRGTNSEDKRKGTRAFLEKLIDHSVKAIVATHDVDIAELADHDQRFSANYFESGHENGNLTFDYRLRSGVCASPNATELLRINGLID